MVIMNNNVKLSRPVHALTVHNKLSLSVIYSIIITIIGMLLLIKPIHAQAQDNIPIAVYDLVSIGVSQEEMDDLINSFRSAIFKSGKFDVMDKPSMYQTLSEDLCAIRVGKLLKVKLIVIGSAEKLIRGYRIRIRIIDIDKEKCIIEKILKFDDLYDFDLKIYDFTDNLYYDYIKIEKALKDSESNSEPVQNDVYYGVLPKVCIIKFEGNIISKEFSDSINNLLRSKLALEHRIELLDERRVDEAIAEKGLKDKIITAESAILLGMFLQCQYVLMGSIASSGENIKAIAYLIEVSSGNIIVSKSSGYLTADKLYEELDAISYVICDKIAANIKPESLSIEQDRFISEELPFNIITEITENKSDSRIVDHQKRQHVVISNISYNIRKNSILNLLNPDSSVQTIGKIRIIEVQNNEATGVVVALKRDCQIKEGLHLKASGKFRKMGIGVFIGYDFLRFMRSFGGGLGMTLDYIGSSGFGYQISGIYILTNDNSYKISINPLTLIVKYHMFTYNPISINIGAGLSLERGVIPVFIYDEYFDLIRITPKYINTSIAPVFNVGIDLFKTSVFHFSLDTKLFISFSKPATTFNFLPSLGISLNW